jgi:hypothetical protein
MFFLLLAFTTLPAIFFFVGSFFRELVLRVMLRENKIKRLSWWSKRAKGTGFKFSK